MIILPRQARDKHRENSKNETVLVRSCYDGVPGSPKGGNPLGCGFSYDAEDSAVRKTLTRYRF